MGFFSYLEGNMFFFRYQSVFVVVVVGFFCESVTIRQHTYQYIQFLYIKTVAF